MDMMDIRRRVLMFDGLPPEYQKYDYLESNTGNNSRIDTGVSGDDETLRIYCTFMPTYLYTNYQGVFGNYKSENNNYCWRCICLNRTRWAFDKALYVTMGNNSAGGGGTMVIYPNCENSSSGGSAISIINTKITLDMTYGSCVVRGNRTYTVTAPNAEKEINTNNICLGANTVGGASGGASIFRYYTFKMWSHGKLIRDYRPCVRKSDNKTGFYDIVNHTFNPSIGTADFIAGND